MCNRGRNRGDVARNVTGQRLAVPGVGLAEWRRAHRQALAMTQAQHE
jgi:hypothetical protein